MLDDTAKDLAARSHVDTAERMVAVLSEHGHTSVDAAFGALGRLISWVVENKPPATRVTGPVVSDYLSTLSGGAQSTACIAYKWLADWTGLNLHARAPVLKRFRNGSASSSRDKESFNFHIVAGLEHIAATHTSEFVSGHAAAWLFLATHALRVEQSRACVVNAFVEWRPAGARPGDPARTITSAAVRRDKHPDRSKRRPRPVWGCFEGFAYPGAARAALSRMLRHAPGVRSVFLETDSKSGAPADATMWVHAPIGGTSRVDASLHSILQMAPISLTPEQAARFHGHSGKRFLMNAAAALCASASIKQELARFSHSTAQLDDLQPTERMLQRHDLAASVLPDIYASKACVELALSAIARVHEPIRAAVVAAGRQAPGDGGAEWVEAVPLSGGGDSPHPRLAISASGLPDVD